jgi:hypothetical protein
VSLFFIVSRRKNMATLTTDHLQAPLQSETAQHDTLVADMLAAAENNARSTFVNLVEKTDWQTRTPEELREALDLSLSLDMVPLARELANLGTRLFPENKILARAAYVIAPPQVVGTQPAGPVKLEASKRWLNENAGKFHGVWVAVREGRLLGTAPTLKKLLELIGPENNTSGTILVKALG